VSLVLRIAGGIVLGYLAINALGYITTMPRWFAKLRWRILPCGRAECISESGYVTVTVDKHGRCREPPGRTPAGSTATPGIAIAIRSRPGSSSSGLT
jgi:hypothetical protein